MKRSKKKGFTLTELLVVMAIIVVLATIIAPKAIGYMQEAKKTKAVEEARQVILAIEAYNINSNSPISDTDKYSDFKETLNTSNYIDTSDIEYVHSDNTYVQLYSIVKQDTDFILNDDGKIELVSAEIE